MPNGNPMNFLVPFGLGLVVGWFIFTATGREVAMTAGERAALEAKRRVVPKIRGE